MWLALAVGGGVLAVGFVTWLIIALVNQKANLELVQTYKLPEFASLADLPKLPVGDAAVAIDGEVAFRGNSEVSPTASTAKMILGLAIMREKPFALGEAGEVLTLSDEDYDRYIWYQQNNGSNVPVAVGKTISEYDALVAVFLASANNMADSLAVWAFGSLDNYREYATQMLGEWGIDGITIGVDASGFDTSTTGTAADLAKIGQKVLENPVLAEIVNTKSREIPVAGLIENTNKLLGQSGIVGVKTGFIGDASGYCLVTGYREGEHIITTAILKAASREESFSESLNLAQKMQELAPEKDLVRAGDIVGYYNSWWTGPVAIRANEDKRGIGWNEAESEMKLEMNGREGVLKIKISANEYRVSVTADEYAAEPSFGERLGHLFGWQKGGTIPDEEVGDAENEAPTKIPTEESDGEDTDAAPAANSSVFTNAPSSNCTVSYGALMLINPNFTVENEFIAARRGELISLSGTYGINERNAYNGDNLLDAEAAAKMNEMVKAYEAENPGHTMETLSCFRAVGTSCGRLCAATGTSDHHTGLTCDLVDPVYGDSLDTSTYDAHPDWQWLKANSYKYGFIDRFPEAWAGGSMSEPLNVDANGSTGLFETWHYRYVGVTAATEIATGKHNNGAYDSLEHYLLARGMVKDLKNGICQ